MVSLDTVNNWYIVNTGNKWYTIIYINENMLLLM